jgi:hypothetical protein
MDPHRPTSSPLGHSTLKAFCQVGKDLIESIKNDDSRPLMPLKEITEGEQQSVRLDAPAHCPQAGDVVEDDNSRKPDLEL